MDYTINTEDPLLVKNELLSLWNSCLGDEFPLDMRLFAQQISLDRDLRSLFTARAYTDNKLIGAVLVKRSQRPDQNGEISAKSYISFILVAPQFQHRGIGKSLLKNAESWCRYQNATTIALGSDYFHFFPGPPYDSSAKSSAALAFFEASGYTKGTIEEDLIANIQSIDKSMLPEDQSTDIPGFSIACSSLELRPRIFDFFAQAFPGRWNNEIHEAFAAGMRDEDLILAIRDSDQSVAGFARIYDEQSPVLGPGLYWRALLGPNPGALGPIGIHAAYRGLGLGIALLRASLAKLKARGVRNTVIDWTDLGAFYAKLGFVPWKRYIMMQKKLD